jgi:hypothetical protein
MTSHGAKELQAAGMILVEALKTILTLGYGRMGMVGLRSLE